MDASHVDDAIEFVVQNGAENRGATLYYTLVFQAAGLAAPQELHEGGDSHAVTAFMKAFHDRCIERGLPPLDSLVVHVAGRRAGFPGSGYFTVNGMDDPLNNRTPPARAAAATQFLEEQQAACRRWGEQSRRGRP